MSDIDTEVAEEVVDAPAPTDTLLAGAEEEAPATEVADTNTLLSDDGGDGDGAAESVVPESYEFTPPEGFEVTPQVQAQLDVFSASATEAGLTQDQYQQLITGEIERSHLQLSQASDAYHERFTSWADATKNDKELGGEQLQANLAVAKRAMDTYGTPGLKELLGAPTADNPDGLGIGNHPEIIRLLHRVGGLLGEDELLEGGQAAESGTNLKKMYPTMFTEAS